MSARVSRRRLRPAAGDDSGFTLTELLVAMGLSMIIGAMTLGLFLSINTTSNTTSDRTVGTASARNAIQSWTGYLRVADGPTAGSRINRILWLTASDLLFYADLGNRKMSSDAETATTAAATRIWLRRDYYGNLIEEQFSATATTGAQPLRCRSLVSRVAATPALFSAVDSTGASMSALNLGTAPAATAATAKCRPLPAVSTNSTVTANLQNVYSVTIDFIVRDTKSKHPLEFTSQAVLPSLGAV